MNYRPAGWVAGHKGRSARRPRLEKQSVGSKSRRESDGDGLSQNAILNLLYHSKWDARHKHAWRYTPERAIIGLISYLQDKLILCDDASPIQVIHQLL